MANTRKKASLAFLPNDTINDSRNFNFSHHAITCLTLQQYSFRFLHVYLCDLTIMCML